MLLILLILRRSLNLLMCLIGVSICLCICWCVCVCVCLMCFLRCLILFSFFLFRDCSLFCFAFFNIRWIFWISCFCVFVFCLFVFVVVMFMFLCVVFACDYIRMYVYLPRTRVFCLRYVYSAFAMFLLCFALLWKFGFAMCILFCLCVSCFFYVYSVFATLLFRRQFFKAETIFQTSCSVKRCVWKNLSQATKEEKHAKPRSILLVNVQTCFQAMSNNETYLANYPKQTHRWPK